MAPTAVDTIALVAARYTADAVHTVTDVADRSAPSRWHRSTGDPADVARTRIKPRLEPVRIDKIIQTAVVTAEQDTPIATIAPKWSRITR